ncbi:S66 peptidase family protein [Salmonirosea aquatica]|uniref:LD-carboxypeptidase n=1 Tax=Salmonirosea aquatica TaxID=2654236 RepID=A0A7C9BGT5_9BACT|nr:LD-carboxypeptidase [Cytophagaceae bacterium SJW1-29]
MTLSLLLPPYLQPGDTVGVLAPASKVSYDDCVAGLHVLRNEWHLNVVECPTLWSEYYQYSGTDQQRRDDMQSLLDNPDVKAILAARGGYGCSRIVDDLDFTAFEQSPKWLVGFSDLTALLAHLGTLGYASIHGPMVKTMAHEGGEQALESLRKALFGESMAYSVPAHPLNRPGIADGLVMGGNLCLLAHLVGSSSEVDTQGTLLFIEDINEYLYNIDRMMIQLKRAGKLQNLAGLIVGQFTEVRDNSDPAFGKTAYEIIADHTQEYSFPICFDFPVGHVADNRALPVGLMATLDVSEYGGQLRYPTNS